MPKLSSNVGQGGINKKHDVALVQAMLRVIKNPKGQPYVSFAYDGVFSPGGATFKAIKALQEDHKTNGGPPPETAGKMEINGKTLDKMNELLPASHKDIRALEGFSVVYIAGTMAEAQAAAARVTSDPHFTNDFKTKLSLLITTFYQKYGIVLSVNPDWANGGFRTFQEQRDLMDKTDENGNPVTQAGPGESNHNWGNGADVGINHFAWLKGDGTAVKIPGVAGVGDGPWLSKLKQFDLAAYNELWKLRNQATSLFPSTLPDDMSHLQTFSDNNISMGISLAKHMSKVSDMWWEYKEGSYWCNFGLANQDTKFRIGSAKRIWDKAVNVVEASLATALNQAEERRKISPLPDYEEAIRKTMVGLTPNPPAVWKASDIKGAHCDQMRTFMREELVMAEKNYTDWVPYDKSGNPM